MDIQNRQTVFVCMCFLLFLYLTECVCVCVYVSVCVLGPQGTAEMRPRDGGVLELLKRAVGG